MKMLRILLPAALLLAACGDAPPGTVAVGKPVPPYVAQVLDGDRTSLADLQGRPVLLNVWATWCGPCQKEIPALEALHREYGPKGLRVVGVASTRRASSRPSASSCRSTACRSTYGWTPAATSPASSA
jgi:thiol-disulfide isomerase/thioredoxin